MESHKLQPRLISGECEQALVTATYNAPRRKETHFSESRHNELALKTLLYVFEKFMGTTILYVFL